MVIHLSKLQLSLSLINALNNQIINGHAGARLNSKTEFLHVVSLARFSIFRLPAES